MQEREVTIDRETWPLPADFTVFATQNPLESEGTYPLPEAQKDRFMLKISISWPEREEELQLLERMMADESPESVLVRGDVQPVMDGPAVAMLQNALRMVTVRPEIIAYMLDVVRRTRTSDNIFSGAGPRAAQSLLFSSRAHAALAGRDFVTPDDVRAMLQPVLEHRILLRPEAEIEGVTVAEELGAIVKDVAVPR